MLWKRHQVIAGHELADAVIQEENEERDFGQVAAVDTVVFVIVVVDVIVVVVVVVAAVVAVMVDFNNLKEVFSILSQQLTQHSHVVTIWWALLGARREGLKQQLKASSNPIGGQYLPQRGHEVEALFLSLFRIL